MRNTHRGDFALFKNEGAWILDCRYRFYATFLTLVTMHDKCIYTVDTQKLDKTLVAMVRL